jgi:hypothetical protein
LGVFRRHCRTHCSCVLTRSPCSLEAVHLVVSDHGTHGGAHGCLGGADDDEYEIPDIPKVEEPKKNAGLDEEEELSDDEKSNVPGVSSKPCCLTLCRCVTQGTDCGAVVVGVEPRSPSPRPRRARKSTRATGWRLRTRPWTTPSLRRCGGNGAHSSPFASLLSAVARRGSQLGQRSPCTAWKTVLWRRSPAPRRHEYARTVCESSHGATVVQAGGGVGFRVGAGGFRGQRSGGPEHVQTQVAG